MWLGAEREAPLSSGRSCYVFDERGNLTEWVPETGDGSRLDNLAGQALPAISVENALKQIANQ